ncbi:MAG: FKBP-type peptidyl-prolyl cis-trans isomerase [Thiobacillaceae bacterium]|nr:FKBP-type peptidyl-prolyl cis-trans isomerase [Thiobacillaceae bacterium]MCX7673903.1 FKBP-type peptidyl-prolyl cis-trans isomerase [Thiobacillaceae bacterium]MDW8324613.1 FKBP-type peptidyl-prolyl cis-trans isomerase [Burkholderiales bacterium]
MSGLRLGDTVTLHYRLTCGGQTVADTFGDAPETFVLGRGDIEPRLELCLLGLRPGAHSRFELGPGEAFGDRDEGLVQRLPRDEFPADMALAVGHRVEFTLPNGQRVYGTVRQLDEAEVEIDFNHPLAGLPVEFEVEIIAIGASGHA